MVSATRGLTSTPQQCAVCSKKSDEGVTLMQCSQCKKQWYCGRSCQTYRGCDDDSEHEGMLELITWESKEWYGHLGWGHTYIELADDLKRKFEVEFKGDLEKLYLHFPRAFRWTCCGTHAGMKFGCDHHGTGAKPCTCDFCHMGKPLPESLYYEKSAPRRDLRLQRGPDPRSFDHLLGALAATSRAAMGLVGPDD